jgi:simple sugar transport system permease protein
MEQSIKVAELPKKQKKSKDILFHLLTKYGTVLAILVIVLLFSVLSEEFFTYKNWTDILRAISITTLVAIGVTLSLIVNGFDLSVGSTVSLATISSTVAMVWFRQETVVAICIPLVIGLLVGLINSFLIVKIRLPDMLATLGMMYMINGLHLTITKGYSVYNNMPLQDGTLAPGKILPSFLFIGQGELFSVPFPVIIMFFFVITVHLCLNYTKFGRLLYVTGGNEEAARLSGVPVKRYKAYAYALSGLFASIAGIVLASRIGTGQVSAGASLLMDSVAAALIGYSVFGANKPNVLGTFVGSVLIGILLNGLTMLNVPYYAQDIVKGAILVGALTLMYKSRKVT